MKYVLVLTQSGGCDYTIGCGTKLVPLEAPNAAAATMETRQLFGLDRRDEYGNWEYNLADLENVTLLGVTEEVVFDRAELLKERDALKYRAAAEITRKAELQELERLARRHGKTIR